ncbi:hypothetical protein AAVH_16651 [Aphelenchoides avenae]|nr:hypothetical protein AAVH_16651 [Aphelenchus avenae]
MQDARAPEIKQEHVADEAETTDPTEEDSDDSTESEDDDGDETTESADEEGGKTTHPEEEDSSIASSFVRVTDDDMD